MRSDRDSRMFGWARRGRERTDSRRRPGYAEVTATVALVLAMGGGAFAAGHYLITSTKQISPSVLKQLQGKAGAGGAPGAAGAQQLRQTYIVLAMATS